METLTLTAQQHNGNSVATADQRTEYDTSGLFADLSYLQQYLPALAQSGLEAFDPPALTDKSEYTNFVNTHQMNKAERLLLLLALIQHADPKLLETLADAENTFRLLVSQKNLFVLPTAETFITLIAAGSVQKRIEAHRYFDTNHVFYTKSVIQLGEAEEGASPFFGVLKISPAYRDLFLYNRHQSPRFSAEFPAHCIKTNLAWEDLALGPSASARLKEVLLVNTQMSTLNQNLSRHRRSGYRCLLNGPSGTGKTLSAKLLGKSLGREVYRVDLSAVISKYVGETSKNLNALFNMAEDKNWILFFDEGDALFGKRVDTSQADDKNSHYSNQDVAFLLQRIEEYSGLIIISTNLRTNMDAAFSRRFEMLVNYDLLNVEQRLKFWQDNLPPELPLAQGFNLKLLVDNHPHATPGQIMNVIIRITTLCLARGDKEIRYTEVDRMMLDEKIK